MRGPMPPDAAAGPTSGGEAIARRGPGTNAAFSAALQMKAQGDCAQAALHLRPIANLGPGYENAQTALGECLLKIGGNTELTPDYLEGMTWLRRAGDAGWPEAQIALAEVHALGPMPVRNTPEAAYWLALYKDNTNKSRIGFVAPPDGTVEKIDATLSTADRAAGVQRAATWQRKAWIPPARPQRETDREERREMQPNGSGMRRRGPS